MINRESNCRAHSELGSSKPSELLKLYKDITLADVHAYLVVIIMGLVELPNEDDYWSTDTILAQGIMQNILSRNRFQQIKHCLMAANPTPAENESDRLAKVHPFLDLLQQISWACYNPQHQLSLDESQCKCGHRYSCISYRWETKKPITDYIKVSSLHCAHCGYCYSFMVDTRDKLRNTLTLVLDVYAPLPQKPFCIATDRFYTSVDTAKKLLEKGLYVYGTVRTDRGIDKKLEKTAKQQPLKDGEWRWSMAPPQLLSWFRRNTTQSGVWFLSTCHDGHEFGEEVRRRRRGSASLIKTVPVIAIDYNTYMGGCDRANFCMLPTTHI